MGAWERNIRRARLNKKLKSPLTLKSVSSWTEHFPQQGTSWARPDIELNVNSKSR